MSVNTVAVDLNEEETCVDCGKKLGYKKGLHISLRPHYVEGHGSHCDDCHISCRWPNIIQS